MQYLIGFRRLELASDVIYGGFVQSIIPDKLVKFRDPRSNRSRDKFPPKPSEAAVSTVFRDNFRPEIVTDVISGTTVAYTSVDVIVKRGDSGLKRGRFIRLAAGWSRFTPFMQYLIVFCSRLEAASDVISGRFVSPIVLDK